MNTAYGNTALIAGVVQRCDQHLGRALYLLRSRNHLHNLIQQIGDVICRLLPVLTHPAVLGRTIDHREVQLILSGIQ